MFLKYKIIFIMTMLLFIDCSSNNKCINYDANIMLINECSMYHKMIFKKSNPLQKNHIIVAVEESNYYRYNKIGEVVIICPVDYSDIHQGCINILMDLTPHQIRDIHLRLKLAKEKVFNKIKEVSLENGADGYYLIGISSDLNISYDKNINRILLVTGCKNYIFCKFELLVNKIAN